MAQLSGGTTVAGYTAIHSGLAEIFLSGNITMATDKRLIFGPNTTWGGKLSIGGNSHNAGTKQGSIFVSDGNLHLDAGSINGVYLNYNIGNSTYFGNGATAIVAKIDSAGAAMFGTTSIYNSSQLNVHKAGDVWHVTIGDMGAGVLKMGGYTASGGLIQSWNQATNAARDLYLQRDGGSVAIGGTSASYKLDVKGDIISDSWIRTRGNTGLYFQDWGGGWYMSDATWIRTQSSKSIWIGSGNIGTDGYLTVGYGGGTGAAKMQIQVPGVTPPRPGGTWAGIIENNVDAAGNHGLLVGARYGANTSTIFEVASYWNGSAQAYTPALSVFGDRSVRVPKALVIPVGADMYAT